MWNRVRQVWMRGYVDGSAETLRGAGPYVDSTIRVPVVIAFLQRIASDIPAVWFMWGVPQIEHCSRHRIV